MRRAGRRGAVPLPCRHRHGQHRGEALPAPCGEKSPGGRLFRLLSRFPRRGGTQKSLHPLRNPGVSGGGAAHPQRLRGGSWGRRVRRYGGLCRRVLSPGREIHSASHYPAFGGGFLRGGQNRRGPAPRKKSGGAVSPALRRGMRHGLPANPLPHGAGGRRGRGN
ncbi:hypothetical protein SDC9_210925 [bioreactor metagenome]|uniref:Uncharacterized protein n=1 Tax=bioreactor metagenome TaxID=1076179 RepID=A0A645JJ85_9ZZZZ